MISIDLDGPNGNAFFLLGQAKTWAKDLGLDYSNIQKEMTNGDYTNLCKTFLKYFGVVCNLETSDAELALELYNEKGVVNVGN